MKHLNYRNEGREKSCRLRKSFTQKKRKTSLQVLPRQYLFHCSNTVSFCSLSCYCVIILYLDVVTQWHKTLRGREIWNFIYERRWLLCTSSHIVENLSIVTSFPSIHPSTHLSSVCLSLYLLTGKYYVFTYVPSWHEGLRMFLKLVFPSQYPENCDPFCHYSTLQLPFGSLIAQSCFSYLWLFASIVDFVVQKLCWYFLIQINSILKFLIQKY